MKLHVKSGPSFGEQLREAREAANLSQKELSDRLGVSPRTVQYWEAGKIPQPKHRRAIAAFIDGDDEEQAA
jgi:transcriptional regulator with XRE-family HTH domain